MRHGPGVPSAPRLRGACCQMGLSGSCRPSRSRCLSPLRATVTYRCGSSGLIKSEPGLIAERWCSVPFPFPAQHDEWPEECACLISWRISHLDAVAAT
jgi:hypothetical protein